MGCAGDLGGNDSCSGNVESNFFTNDLGVVRKLSSKANFGYTNIIKICIRLIEYNLTIKMTKYWHIFIIIFGNLDVSQGSSVEQGKSALKSHRLFDLALFSFEILEIKNEEPLGS